jgi:hypothetical protein
MRKPRVFIGSSKEGLPVAHTLEEHLVHETEPILWTNDVFAPSSTIIESLEQVLDTVEFSVLVVTPDDLRTKHEITAEVPRDNVVFELGLFMGRLGRDRTFLLKVVKNDSDPQLPTDLLGMTVVSVDSTRSDGDMAAAVSPAVSKLLRAIKKAPRRQPAGERSNYQNVLLDEDQFLHAIVSWPLSGNAITIALGDTVWAWKIFPALLCWRLKKTPVLAYTLPPSGSSTQIRQEKARRELLVKLGVHVKEVNTIEKTGVFRQTDYPEDTFVIICSESGGKYAPFAIQYDGMMHSQATLSLLAGVTWPERDAVDEGLGPQLEVYGVQDVVEKLRRGVHQYSSPDVVLEGSVVNTNDLYLMTPFARAFKYRQIGLLFQEYQRVSIAPFQAMSVRLTSREYSIITPPVVEIHDIGPVVVEGTTRATFCRDNHIQRFHCIRVTGVRDPLPGNPVPIDQVAVAARSLTPTERMENFNYNHFRHIERAVHPY